MKFIFTLFLIVTFTFSKAQLLYTFDDADISDWSIEGDGSISYDADSGNPGGCIFFDDPASGLTTIMTTPNTFLGQWNDDDQTLSFDVFVETSDDDLIDDFPWVFEISGPGGIAHALPFFTCESNVWQHISVPISEENWDIFEGNWDSILQYVNQLRIRIEFISGLENVYLDNIALSFTPETIPLNGDVCSNFETYGFDGWQFTGTGDVEYLEDGGNPMGGILINDALGVNGYAHAPYKFLGDWTVLGEDAFLYMDLRINATDDLYTSKEYLLKIEGVGGEAIIPADLDSIALAINQ